MSTLLDFQSDGHGMTQNEPAAGCGRDRHIAASGWCSGVTRRRIATPTASEQPQSRQSQEGD
jgi:hypothetical protein